VHGGDTHAESAGSAADTTSHVGAVRVDPADDRLRRLPGDYRQQSLLVSSVCVVQYIFRVAYGRSGPLMVTSLTSDSRVNSRPACALAEHA
jgi:hypothetical protein